MARSPSRAARRAWLAAATLAVLGAGSCDGGSSPASLVETLRVLGVTMDTSYSEPGGTVTLRLTYSDAGDGAEGARPVEVTWLGGCLDPANGDFVACYPALAPALSAVRAGEQVPGLVGQEVAPPEKSGVPDAVSFDFTIPPDALERPAGEPAAHAVAYVFFAVCAGAVRPIPVGAEGGFPLECIGDDGAPLGGDSFVVGYTKVQVFGDGRRNENPPVEGLSLDGEPLGADPESAPVVPLCTRDQQVQCGQPLPEPCPTYEIEAIVGDVAEEDPGAFSPEGVPLREAVWVNHFADGGSFAGSTRLVSDPKTGWEEDHATAFTPPSEPGLVTLWAVVRDSRGGASVARGFLRVE